MVMYGGSPTDITENGVRKAQLVTSPVIQGTIDPGTGLTIPAHTLSGKLTAGASEIEGSAFDINGGTIDGVTITSPTINGTIATTGLTLPAVTLGGTVTVNGQVFDAGASFMQVKTTGSNIGLRVDSTNEGVGGGRLIVGHVSSSPAVDDLLGSIAFAEAASIGAWTYNGAMNYYIENITGGSEATKLAITLMSANADNVVLTLSGAGVLAVDLSGSGGAAQVDLFDDYDDAVVIRQGIQENNRELLADIGVLDRKDTGSGYMMKIQPMVRLLAGGIYQNRALVEEVRDELLGRLELVERKLLEVK